MRRREFITLIGGAAITWPLTVRAQPSGGVRRIGILINGAEADPEIQLRITAFRRELGQLGWSDGHNVRIDTRYSAADPEQLPQLANKLVALQPDVIFAHTTPAVKALQKETRTIPIVFVEVSDPIGSRIVPSLARPGGNITGLMLYEEGITGKWLGMLKEIAPRIVRVALVANPELTPYDYFLRSARAVAPALGIDTIATPITNAADIEHVMDATAHAPNSGVVVLPDGTSMLHRDLIIALAARYRLPVVYAFRFFVTAGGLMSYSTEVIEQNRQAASYVDRILRGTNAADLPVQAPTKYETVVNLQTAKALGLDVPPTLLVRADEVIE